jgi:hypothetical protein
MPPESSPNQRAFEFRLNWQSVPVEGEPPRRILLDHIRALGHTGSTEDAPKASVASAPWNCERGTRRQFAKLKMSSLHPISDHRGSAIERVRSDAPDRARIPVGALRA